MLLASINQTPIVQVRTLDRLDYRSPHLKCKELGTRFELKLKLKLKRELELELQLQLQLELDVKLNTPTQSLTVTRSQTQILEKKLCKLMSLWSHRRYS